MKIIVSAPGKIILSGEHAVVHGKPAIAAAVDRRLIVTLQRRDDGKRVVYTDAGDTKLVKTAIKVVKDELKLRKNTDDRHMFFTNSYELNVRSEVPVGAGMGSSAAVAVSVISAFMVAARGKPRFDYKRINDLAYKVEKIQHGNPSGIDNSTVTFGGFLWYRKELEFLKTFWKLQFKIAQKLNNFYLINTGKPDESTKEMVEMVKEKIGIPVESNCKKHITIVSKFLHIFSNIENVTKQMLSGIKNEDEALLIESIKQNERLLEKLGVVGEFAKGIVREIESSGGVAKISGAGGVKDKSGLLLVYHKDEKEIERIAKKHKLDYYPAKLGVEGLRIERITV